MAHYRSVAAAQGLARSRHKTNRPTSVTGLGGTSVKRTSKQTWLSDTGDGGFENGTLWSIGPYQVG
jgi:hypothetical protein